MEPNEAESYLCSNFDDLSSIWLSSIRLVDSSLDSTRLDSCSVARYAGFLYQPNQPAFVAS
jgi:hypothetical protein